MENINNIFSSKNTIHTISDDERKQTGNYLEVIKAFSRTIYTGIYVIDYKKNKFEYVSENPLFLCGHTAEEVKEMGIRFYFKNVPQPDLDLILEINSVGFNFYNEIALKERKCYTLSCDFHLKNQEGEIILINQKITPLFLTDDGKIWKAICIVSLSSERYSGNIKIYKRGGAGVFKYDLEEGIWNFTEKLKLSRREKEVLGFSIRGFTINEVARVMNVSPDTVKFHRKKIYRKLGVANISEAIVFATNNKLI